MSKKILNLQIVELQEEVVNQEASLGAEPCSPCGGAPCGGCPCSVAPCSICPCICPCVCAGPCLNW